MKPITAMALHDILDTDLVWRRRELTSLITAAKGADAATKTALIRAAVPLLYAHWEGFGRVCFERYLEHVSYKNIKYKNLHPSFLYLETYGRMQEIGRVPAQSGIPLLSQFMLVREKVNRNPFRKMIDTKSNLRFEVLCQLCALCGIDQDIFKDDATFIDNEVCDLRNAIAHGSASAPAEEVFIRRRDRAFLIMTKLQTQLVNSAINSAYRA